MHSFFRITLLCHHKNCSFCFQPCLKHLNATDFLPSHQKSSLFLFFFYDIQRVKDFENKSLVLLFFVPGGYHHANTARCWASLTALMVGRKLPQDVPDHKVNTADGKHSHLTQDQGFEGLNLGSGRKPFPVAFSVGFSWWDNCVDLFKKFKK